jgi:hypothetical protein
MQFPVCDLHRLSMNGGSYSRYIEFTFMSTYSVSTLKYINQGNPRVLPEIRPHPLLFKSLGFSYSLTIYSLVVSIGTV